MLTTATPLLIKLRTGMAMGALALLLAGCGSTKWGFPYRADVQQGNWITAEQVARLEKGMTREQVRFVLGTPALQDIFRANRWDYTYYNKPGYGAPEERQFTVWFDGDVLARWEGDEQPSRQPFQAPQGPEAKSDASGGLDADAQGMSSDAPRDDSAPRAPATNSGVEINAPALPSPAAPNQATPQPLR